MSIRIVRDTVTPWARKVDSRAHSLDVPLRAIGGYVLDASHRAFRNSADPTTGARWAPIKPATIAARKSGSTKILIDTRELLTSIHSFISSSTTVTTGTNVKHGKPHQDGIGIIARPFVGVDAHDVDVISEIALRWVSNVG